MGAGGGGGWEVKIKWSKHLGTVLLLYSGLGVASRGQGNAKAKDGPWNEDIDI